MKFTNFELIEIEKIDFRDYNGVVHDLEVANTHSYNVNGLAVHNSLCTTRLVTGHGVPQLHAIMECAPEGPIIADGGLRHSGDIVKALAAGAKAVMVGSLLAGTEETPGGELNKPRQYRGMASEEAQLAFKGAVQNGIAEGVAKTVPHKGSVWPVIQALLGGIRSGMSYSGARTLQELRECAKFIDVSTNTLIENHPHGKNQ